MKIKLLVAVLLFAVAPTVAQCNFSDSGAYHGYVCVASAAVSNWNGCTGTLNVVVANDTPYTQNPFAFSFGVELAGQLGITSCATGTFDGQICNMPIGSDSGYIGTGAFPPAPPSQNPQRCTPR